MVKKDFKDSVTQSCFIVNYIWLCPREEEQDDVATQLPLHYFERLYNNAKKYPKVTVNLWLDFCSLNDMDRFFLDSQRYFLEACGVNICDLRSVDEYNNSPGFDLDSNIAIYARADYARVLVLKKLMRENPNITCVYSDLDCEDISVNDQKVNDTLNEYGVVFGHAGKNMSCNGFIALKGSGAKIFMDDYLAPRTLKAFQKNLINHYGAFARSIGVFRNKHHPGINRATWGLVELPCMRTTMPYNSDMYEGVCLPRPTRVPGSKELV